MAGWSTSQGLALAEDLLGDGGLFPMMPVDTGVTVGDQRSARRLGTCEVGGEPYLVYTYRERKRHELAAARLTRGIEKLNDRFSVAIDPHHSWAHEICGQQSATLYSLASDTGNPGRDLAEFVARRRRLSTRVDLQPYGTGTWRELAVFESRKTVRLTALGTTHLLVTEKDGPRAVLCDIESGTTVHLVDERFGWPIAALGDGRALAVGPEHTAVFSPVPASWASVGSRPHKKASVGAHATLADGSLLMTFFKFDSGSAGGFDWSDEKSWACRFAPDEGAWQTIGSGRVGSGNQGRIPIARATPLADGRVLLCEHHRKLIYDPRLQGRKAFIDAGPALYRDECFQPNVFALRDGGCLAIIETIDYPARRRYQAVYERWAALYQPATGFWELARKIKLSGRTNYVQLSPEVFAALVEPRRKDSDAEPKRKSRGRIEFFAPLQREWGVKGPKLPFSDECRAAVAVSGTTVAAATDTGCYVYRIPA